MNSILTIDLAKPFTEETFCYFLKVWKINICQDFMVIEVIPLLLHHLQPTEEQWVIPTGPMVGSLFLSP